MRKHTGWLFLFLILGILLCACSAVQDDVIETTAPTEPAPTAAPTEPEETEPEVDAASGRLMFYFDDHKVQAGAPMSDLIDIGIDTLQDLDQILQPLHMSEVLTVRVDLEEKEFEDDPLIFVVAVNADKEPQPVSQCRIYSITVNTESGIPFGSGCEKEPFVTGTTTRDQITQAYGEPGFTMSGDARYEAITYYQSFNNVYFTFKNGVVRQIVTCYSADIFGDLAENFTYDLGGAYFGSDCAILMSQYLDVTPYLDGTAAVEKLEVLEESIILGGQTIEFGMRAAEMPTPFGEPFVDHLSPVNHNYYVRTGRDNEEEFYLYNLDGQPNNTADRLVVKGVLTENCNYHNWGFDNSEFHPFEYMGLSNDATIEDLLEKFGAPKSMQFDSNGRVCYAWLSYEAVNGNKMLLRVDPILDQIVELQVSKYYPGEKTYK